MSTDKATPRPWTREEVKDRLGVHAHNWKDAEGYHVGAFWPTSRGRNAHLLIHKAVNSHNPERDKLARELAEAWLSPATDNHTPEQLDEVARKLLRLL